MKYTVRYSESLKIIPKKAYCIRHWVCIYTSGKIPSNGDLCFSVSKNQLIIINKYAYICSEVGQIKFITVTQMKQLNERMFYIYKINEQKQPPEVFYKKGVLRNFTNFIGKHLRQSLFFNKVAGLSPATLLKKSLWHRCFPVNFEKFLRTPFLQNTSGRMLPNEIK